ncbi:MAG TPA: TetR/AcrR family transcriptional regulator [Microbacteriaceae bacterium]
MTAVVAAAGATATGAAGAVAATVAATAPTTGDHRARTRRRGAALTAAIYEATLTELTRHGYAALTMETVAKRAHTGKASLYRRWPTRTELVMDAVYDALPTEQLVPETGTLRGDLIEMLTTAMVPLSGALGDALRALHGEALIDADQARRVRDYSRDGAVESLRTIVMRAVARGELDGTHVTRRRLEAGPSILRNHFLFRELDGFDVVELVDEVIVPLLNAPLRRVSRGA